MRTSPSRGVVHEVIEYIHNDPVMRGLVGRPEDWPWSTARALLAGVNEPIAIDHGIPTWHDHVK
jgi:hypothetical protein